MDMNGAKDKSLALQMQNQTLARVANTAYFEKKTAAPLVSSALVTTTVSPLFCALSVAIPLNDVFTPSGQLSLICTL